MRWTVLTLVLAAVVAGCGGGGSDSLTHAPWVDRADAACKRAGQAIVKRGWADDLRSLQTLSSDAVSDVREAITAIRRLPRPPDAANRVRPFLATVGDLDRVFDDLLRATTAMDTVDLRRIGGRLGGKLAAVEVSARGAGLRWCVQHDEGRWVPDGIRAPLLAEELARIDRTFPRLTNSSPRSLRRLADELSDVQAELARLDPPARADREMAAYVAAIAEYSSVADESADRAAAGRLPSKLGPRFVRASTAVGRTHNRLMRKLDAAPVGAAEAVPDEVA